MTKEEAKSCIGTIEMLQRLAYNIHGVMDVIDADNCKKIIKALGQEPCEGCIDRAKQKKGEWRKIYLDHVAMGERPSIFYCSTCCQCVAYPMNYCPNCGSYNGGGE